MAEDNENKKQIVEVISKKQFIIISAICGGIVIILGVCFAINRFYDTSYPFDEQVFGSLGDFASGIIGSVIGFYSAYLLILTLQNQQAINHDIAQTNKSTIDANKNSIVSSEASYQQTQLQIFESKFELFYDSYVKSLDKYIKGDEHGKLAFDHLVNDFVDKAIEHENTYVKRTKLEVSHYENFYSDNRTVMSVHLRTLYLLMSLISDSDLDEKDKVSYAKLVRGQLSNEEMLVLRYNCWSPLGRRMQPLCNKYNLIKHIPIMSLIEFKQYYKIIKEQTNSDESKLKQYVNGLDTMFVTLRKYAQNVVGSNNDAEVTFMTSKRYVIKFAKRERGRTFHCYILKDTTRDRRDGGLPLSSTEKALDCIDASGKLSYLFSDFLYELYFQLYRQQV
jgi:hypothetical protein